MTAWSHFEAAYRQFWQGNTEVGDTALTCRPRPRPIWSHPLGEYTCSRSPVSKWVDWYVEEYERQVEMAERIGGWNVPTAHLTTGTHIYAAAFGCEVHMYEDTNPAALPLVASAGEADRLKQPRVADSPTLARVIELGTLVRERIGTEAYLGPPDLQTGFDSAALIWSKEDFYCALVTVPEAVERLTAKCAGLLKEFLKLLRDEFPRMSPAHCPRAWVPPERGPWVSNDECGCFGTNEFARFCLPELTDLSRTFGELGMHCCADAEHQFDLFKRIPNFYAFNRVPGRAGWTGLPETFGGPDGPVLVLGWVPDETMIALAAGAPPGTRFVFVRDCDSADEAQAFLDRMIPQLERCGRRIVGSEVPAAPSGVGGPPP